MSVSSKVDSPESRSGRALEISALAARAGARARVEPDPARRGDRRPGRPPTAAMSLAVKGCMAVVRRAGRRAAVGAPVHQSLPRRHRADARRPGIRSRADGPCALAAGAGGRPDRGQCPARRAHVADRQPHRRAADGLVERRRRLGRARGRLHPAGERVRLLDRPGLSPAAPRPARAGRMRRGRRDRRRVRRAARRRVLCLRARDRRAIRSRASRRSALPRWSAIWSPTCSIRASLGIGTLYVVARRPAAISRSPAWSGWPRPAPASR